MASESTDPCPTDPSLQSVRFVGPATAAVLESDGYDATAITDKRVSYRMLVEAGVNPGVAAKIRREHSLSWSFNSSGDLDRRSTQIRGLGSAEAEWVAASAGDWEATTDEQSDPDQQSPAGAESGDESTPTPWPTHGESTELTTTTDGSSDAITAEAAWRARSKPTPVTELEAVDEAAADRLAEAGITSVRSLATADPEHVADVLGLSQGVVDTWYQAATATHNQSK